MPISPNSSTLQNPPKPQEDSAKIHCDKIIGIDPGVAGALALLDSEGHLLQVEDMPITTETKASGKGKKTRISPQLLWHTLDTMCAHDRTQVVIENVHAMPKQGVASSFNFGRSFGVIEGVVVGHQLPLVYVAPAAWKKSFNLGRDKEKSRLMAIQQWPSMADHFRLKKHSDRAEAALIALHYLRGGRPLS